MQGCRSPRMADDEREPHAAVTPERTVVGPRPSRAMPTCGAAALLVILLATGAARATGPAERRCGRALPRGGPPPLAPPTGVPAAGGAAGGARGRGRRPRRLPRPAPARRP